MVNSDYDNSASGYLVDSFEGIDREFTDVETISTSAVNIVAKAKRYGRWWLLKGLRQEVADEAGYQQRLRKELEVLMQLQHPGVVTAIGLEEVEPLGLCIVMEYVDGITLREWLTQKPQRNEQRRVARELTDIVGYVHSKGFVHRDLKPENIMVTHNGHHVKLVDFGLADSDSHAILKQPAGTEGYMSPEQAQNAVADVRNDIYSLGVVFSKMDLGYGFHHIIKRCTGAVDQRYKNTESLLEAMRKGASAMKQTVLACLVVAVAVIGIYFGIQMRSLRTVTNQDDTKQLEVTAAVDEGRAELDAIFAESGIRAHLDTLSNVVWLMPDFADKLSEEVDASNAYIESIRPKHSETAFAEIKKALDDYLNDHQRQVIEDFNRLKEAYDESFVSGY
jgi:Kae1-associated kinase Bud32